MSVPMGAFLTPVSRSPVVMNLTIGIAATSRQEVGLTQRSCFFLPKHPPVIPIFPYSLRYVFCITPM